jgi:hypothetical protein
MRTSRIILPLFLLLAFGTLSWSAEPPTIGALTSAHLCFKGDPCQTIDGKVAQVMGWDFKVLADKPGEALIVALSTAGGPVLAYLGPQSHLTNLGVVLEPGNALTLVGSFAKVHGTEVFLVKSFTLGKDSITLRDEEGSLLTSR